MKQLLKSILFLLLVTSCTEPYALQSEDFEEALVVEATLTNEFKKQEISISKTYPLESIQASIEKNAIVFVKDDLGTTYNFIETDDKYISENEFQALPNRTYQLFIKTANGKSYISNNQTLTKSNNIDNVSTTVRTINGQKGVEISVNHKDVDNSSKFYRYTYEETSKVTVPKWVESELKLKKTAPYYDIVYALLYFELRTEEARVCYKTTKSKEIILKETTKQSQDIVADFPLKFINYKNYDIAERYSILVNLYTQNLESYTYYKNLKKSAENGNILSPTQPGYIKGNITCVTDNKNKVLGYFEVSSVSSKRIFFNYFDVFTDENTLPDYFNPCNIVELEPYDYEGFREDGDEKEAITLRTKIKNKALIYYDKYFKPNGTITFMLVEPPCGDCRVLGSNVRPSYWID